MSFKSRTYCLLASSALAAMVGLSGAPQAYAAAGNDIIGLSSDGSTMLWAEYMATDVIRLTTTATGNSVTIEAPAGKEDLYFRDLSADGKTAVGSYQSLNNNGSVAVIWTAQDGFVELGTLGRDYSYAVAVSGDGSAVTGYLGGWNNHHEAFYWSRSDDMVAIGTLGGNNSYAANISANGNTVVGYSDRADNTTHAFVWDKHGGLLDIDNLFTSSDAALVSDDGSVVAGSGYMSSSYHVFRWTSADTMVDIGSLGGNTFVRAMSGDGEVLVGQSSVPNIGTHAYRYVASTHAMTDLGTLGGRYSEATDVTSDGRIVVGSAEDVDGNYHGFRWADGQMVSVEGWLANEGVNSGSITTASAEFVSDDGNVIVGMTQDFTTYIARLGSGIIDEATYFPTVANASNVVVQSGVKGADTVMFGAQGQPMRNLLSPGQKSVWGTVDGGYDDSDAAKGGLVLGEFGFGYGVAEGVTARFSAGGNYTNQDLDSGGDVGQRGFYLSPEVTANLGSDIYMTVGGYWGRSSLDSHRGYMNGASMDYSEGDTNAETWGAKLRFDWLNAVTFNDTAITPYVGLSYAHTEVDAFTETGGSFPVSYDKTSDHATVFRLGADFVHPLNDGVRLLAKAELDYQFEDRAASTRGTLTGIGAFDLSGHDLQQFWVRGGVGAEFDVGGGVASVMVNATTQGQDPNVWVRSNWTVKF